MRLQETTPRFPDRPRICAKTARADVLEPRLHKLLKLSYFQSPGVHRHQSRFTAAVTNLFIFQVSPLLPYPSSSSLNYVSPSRIRKKHCFRVTRQFSRCRRDVFFSEGALPAKREIFIQSSWCERAQPLRASFIKVPSAFRSS